MPIIFHRPLGVWIISIFYIASSIIGALMLSFMLLGWTHLTPQAQARISEITAWLPTTIFIFANTIFAICLLSVRRAAYGLFIFLLLLHACLDLYSLFIKHLPYTSGLQIAEMALGWLTSISIFLYLQRITSKGILTKGPNKALQLTPSSGAPTSYDRSDSSADIY